MAFYVMFALSYDIGYSFVTTVVTGAMVANIAVNFLSTFTMLYYLSNDAPHKYWREHCPVSYWLIVILSFVFSFKTMGFIIARFFEWGGTRNTNSIRPSKTNSDTSRGPSPYSLSYKQ